MHSLTPAFCGRLRRSVTVQAVKLLMSGTGVRKLVGSEYETRLAVWCDTVK